MGSKYDVCDFCLHWFRQNSEQPCVNCTFQLPTSFARMYQTKEIMDGILDNDTEGVRESEADNDI